MATTPSQFDNWRSENVLRGRSAVDTGSTSGIGLGIAKALAAAGANVMLNSFGDSKKLQDERLGIE